uniref:Uncharacterized protein n=1 Tax=Arundo donax TaxID=35708 RepID=A0A0A8Z3V9_ARUDO
MVCQLVTTVLVHLYPRFPCLHYLPSCIPLRVCTIFN